jgi:hypothetical protein
MTDEQLRFTCSVGAEPQFTVTDGGVLGSG